jgi:carboxyl-terminal processing protease
MSRRSLQHWPDATFAGATHITRDSEPSPRSLWFPVNPPGSAASYFIDTLFASGLTHLTGMGIVQRLSTVHKDPHPMKQKRTRWLAVAALALAGMIPLSIPFARADEPVRQTSTADAPSPNSQVASVEQLKDQAFKALRLGQFDVGNNLLAQAASVSNDPQLALMHQWTNQFETQLKTFTDERHKSYDKAVADVQLLLKSGHEDAALDFANRAQLLSDDKKAFDAQPWVRTLVSDSIRHASEYQTSEQWLKALRIYSDMASIEPASMQWKEQLKSVTRRVRLLALYTPDELKEIQEKETKERDEIDALVHPTTNPTTKPATNPAADNDNFKIDWHETLHGAKMPMLVSAMHDAAVNYYRNITYKDLLQGGLSGIDAVVTTHGLEKAFPNLADSAKRSAFQAALAKWTSAADAADPTDAQSQLDDLLSDGKDGLLAINADTIQLPEEVLVSEFADGALARLDPFSNMIWPSDLEEFNKTTQGEFSGVGIQIQLDDDGSLKVVSPLEDSPAYKAGIKAGDIISGINGKSAKGISLNQAVKTITGPSGTTVTLTVRSPDARVKDYTIRRETIKVSSVKGYLHKPGGGWDYYVDPANKIAYLRITNFTKTTGDELDKALDDMGNNVNGVIIDLRGNPGGLLSAATEVSDKFLKDGVIVSTHPDRETPNAPTVATAKDDDNEYAKPLVVLVNQYSASASEIVSGCLKDDHRAILVGERTFGKGSVQMLFPLANRTAYLKLTTSHYYLPNGRCIHREENSTEWGVDPDVTVEMTPEQMRAALDARQDMDVLRDAAAPPAEGQDQKLKDIVPAVENAVKAATTQKVSKDPLTTDPQLSAALLVLRLETAGAHL